MIGFLLRYWEDAEPGARTVLLRALEHSSEAMRPAAREKVREYWFHPQRATAATAIKATARLGGVLSEADLTMFKLMAEDPGALKVQEWTDADASFIRSIRFSAAFVVLSSPLDLRESVEWAAGLEGEAREAARGALLGQMLIEDGAFAHAAPDLRIRWLEVFDTMLREIDDIAVRDFAMPLLLVMQRHPECTEQACRTLAYLREHAEDPRLKDSMAQVIRDAGMGDLLEP